MPRGAAFYFNHRVFSPNLALSQPRTQPKTSSLGPPPHGVRHRLAVASWSRQPDAWRPLTASTPDYTVPADLDDLFTDDPSSPAPEAYKGPRGPVLTDVFLSDMPPEEPGDTLSISGVPLAALFANDDFWSISIAARNPNNVTIGRDQRC